MRKLFRTTFALLLVGTVGSATVSAQSGKPLIVNDNQYMRVVHHEDFNVQSDQDFTLSLWIKLDEVLTGANSRFIAKRNVGISGTSDNRTGYEFFGGNSTAASGWAATNVPNRASGNVLSKWSTKGGTVGEWFHLALIVDRAADKISFCHNGTVVASAAVGVWESINTHDLLVGCGISGSTIQYFTKGAIDDLRIYRRALSDTELATEMSTQSIVDLPQEMKTSLRAAYDFENITNLSIPDISGNNHNGVMEYIIPPAEGEVKILSDVVTQETWLTGRGNENDVILKGKFLASGETPSTFQSATIILTGTDVKDIAAIKVYSTSGTDSFDERTPKGSLLGTVANPQSGTIEIPLSGEIRTGYHYLWITTHVADDAKEGNRVDVQWDKLTLASGAYTLTNPNPNGDREIILTKKLIYAPGDYGSLRYRIPALIRAADGSLIIATDKRKKDQGDLPSDIDVLINRSTDGGKTWSEPLTIAEGKGKGKGFGDAGLVKCLNGDLIAIFVGGTGMFQSTANEPIRTYVCKSQDNGITWSEKVDITPQLFGSECSDPVRKKWQASFCASGMGLCTGKGRIMFVAATRHDETRTLYNHVYYSDDNGETWKVSDCAKVGGDEAKVVELNDGTILMSIRRIGGGPRYYNTSTDQGETWSSENRSFAEMIDQGCNGDMIRYSSTLAGADRNRILHTVANHPSTRKDVSIFISYDEGKTWPVKKNLCPTESVYSSIAILPDGTIGVYMEENLANRPVSMYYLNFSLNWMTNGTDPHTGDKTFNVKTTFNSEKGNVKGGGLFAINSKIALNAIPSTGYKFSKWIDKAGTEVSTSNPYEFTLTEETEIEALFDLSAGITTQQGNTLSLHPNPFSETLNIDGVTPGDHIAILNLLGNVVAETVATGSVAQIKTPPSIADGNYILQIKQADSVQSTQILKRTK